MFPHIEATTHALPDAVRGDITAKLRAKIAMLLKGSNYPDEGFEATYEGLKIRLAYDPVDTIKGTRQMPRVSVTPENADVKGAVIAVGGLGVNTPIYYAPMLPFAYSGIRFDFVNTLGGGSQSFAARNKHGLLYDPVASECSVRKHIIPEGVSHLKLAMDAVLQETTNSPFRLLGESLGALPVAHVVNSGYEEFNNYCESVHFDAPGTLGANRWTHDFRHFINLALYAGKSKYYRGMAGLDGEIPEELLSCLMMAEAVEDTNSQEIVDILFGGRFEGLGFFPEYMFDVVGKDPIRTVDSIQNLKGKDVTYYLRLNDRTTPTSRIITDIVQYRKLGIAAQGIVSPFSNDHLNLAHARYNDPNFVAQEYWPLVMPFKG